MDWFSQNSDAIIAIFSLISLFTTITLIIITWHYARETKKLTLESFQPRIETFLAIFPFVNKSLNLEANFIVIRVKNIGGLTARNIKLEILKNPEELSFNNNEILIPDLLPNAEYDIEIKVKPALMGILKTKVGNNLELHHMKMLDFPMSLDNLTISINLSYGDDLKKSYLSQKIDLDLLPFKNYNSLNLPKFKE